MKPLLDRGLQNPRDDVDDFPPWPRRTAAEIATRCIALGCVIASLDFMPGQFNEWLRRENLWDEPSPRELEQLTASSLRSRQTIDASLQSEALQVLMWSIGAITTLQPFTELYTSGMPHALPAPGEDTAEFISHAILRSDEEIDSALNLIVDAHWQLRNEQFFPEEEAIPMNPGVVRERHWALEWIVNVGDDPWDQLQTNT